MEHLAPFCAKWKFRLTISYKNLYNFGVFYIRRIIFGTDNVDMCSFDLKYSLSCNCLIPKGHSSKYLCFFFQAEFLGLCSILFYSETVTCTFKISLLENLTSAPFILTPEILKYTL